MSKTNTGFHLLTVKEYSRVKEMGEGNYVTDTFRVGGYDWQVVFNPHRKDATDKGFVAIQLGTDRETTVEALYEFTLLDHSGKRKHRIIASSMPHYRRFTEKDCWWGNDFASYLSLDSSDYLNDDSLTICCMVSVFQSGTKPNNFTIPSPPNMEKNFKYFLDSELGCDIIFRVKDETFKAHKVILAACSPVFRAQFYGLVGNPALDEVVELMDIEPTVFQAMLLFIYSDKLPDSHLSMGSMSHMIQHLLVAADRFGLDGLKHLCEAKLCEELNVDVVATTLSLAHDHQCSQLKTICMDFAVANLQAVIDTEGYKYIETSCPSLLSELLRKIASEIESK